MVLIITNDGIGTGSFVGSDNLIITNWHVVQSNQFVKVAFMPRGLGAKFSEAEVAIARVISLKKQKDLALLKLEQWDKPLPKSIELASQNDINRLRYSCYWLPQRRVLDLYKRLYKPIQTEIRVELFRK